MIREDRFFISRRPYAVNLDGCRVTPSPERAGSARTHYVAVKSVWFRRKAGVTVACIGRLWTVTGDTAPTSARDALKHYLTDGRYGGKCDGRWDGTRYWGSQEPQVAAAHLAVLRPMLDDFPQVPDGYDGWWRFTR